MMSVCLLIAFYAAGPPLATPERPILLQKSAKKKRSHFREGRERRQLQRNTKLSVRELCNAAAEWLAGNYSERAARSGRFVAMKQRARRACGSACVIFASHYALILMRDKLDFN